MRQLIARLMGNNQLTYKEIISLAEHLGYIKTGKTGSHEKYERSGYPQLVVVVGQKRAQALRQYRIEKQLKQMYVEILS